MASFDQKLRTLRLMEILLDRTDDTHMLNASELCTILDQEYGISTDRRTIYTEMEILEKFGLDIQQKKGKNPGYYIGARDFELPELKLLVDAVQSSKFITEKKSKELITKLEKLCCRTDAAMLSKYVFIAFFIELSEEVAGYLKPVSDAVETEFGTFMELALPNKEIRRVYNTEILSWLRGTVDGNVMAGLEKALYLNDGKKLQEFLRKYMITCISCFDGAAEGRTRSGGPWLCADRSGTETFYHGMMLGLAAGMSSRYYIRSNRESGEGRFDLVLEPKVHFLPGIIMEFKATKNDAGLSASADEALKQIEDKHYDTDMKDRGIREIVKYGIAFAGKNVEIAIG